MKKKKDLNEVSIEKDQHEELKMNLRTILQSDKVFTPNNVIVDYLAKTKGNINDIINLVKPFTHKEEEVMLSTSALIEVMEALAEKFNIEMKFSADKDILMMQAFYVISLSLLAMQNNIQFIEKQLDT